MKVQCACGTEVLWVINAEFPGMGLVLDPEPAESGGIYRVAQYSVTGQPFGKRSTDPAVPKHNPHKATCPFDRPRRAGTATEEQP